MTTREWTVAALAALLGSTLTLAGQQTGTRRIPQFENADVRVWKSIITPNQPLSMHRHDHPRVLVALKGGTMRIAKESGGSRTEVWETGNAYWLTADPPDELHGDVNEGDENIEVVVIELQRAGR